MSALKNMPISFPGLFGDWELNIDPVAIHIGHGIYWYGIILAFAMLAGLYLCMKQAKHYGLTEDNIMDMVLWAVPCCIIGARFYYVLFYLDLYRNTDGSLDWGAMFRIWDGGLAIYGAVIAGVLVALVYTKRHKLPFFAMGDVAVMGLLLGQIIGRWANFINREAFGGETTLPWRMKLWVSQYTSIEVHPTFFYESFWNLIGLLLIQGPSVRRGEHLVLFPVVRPGPQLDRGPADRQPVPLQLGAVRTENPGVSGAEYCDGGGGSLYAVL